MNFSSGLGRNTKRELAEATSSKRLAQAGEMPEKASKILKPAASTSVRHSIGGPADLSRPVKPTTRMSMGGADLRVGKENVRPRLATKASLAKPEEELAKPEPQLHVGLFWEVGEQSEQPSLIREQAIAIYDSAVVDSLSALLSAKIGGAKKFDFSKDKEQTLLNANMKAGLSQMRDKTIQFRDASMEIESRMAADAEAQKQVLNSALASNGELKSSLESVKLHLSESSKEVETFKELESKWNVEREEKQQEKDELVTNNTLLEKEKRKLQSDLQQSEALAEFRGSELEKVRESLQAREKEIKDIQSARVLAEVELQHTFNAKIAMVTSQLVDANAQNKLLHEVNAALEQKRQEAALKQAVLQGELEVERNKHQSTQRDLERAVFEIGSLKSELADKGTQFMSMMEGFQRSQKFHEERLTVAFDERRELDAKLLALQTKKEELEGSLRETTTKLNHVTQKGIEEKQHLEHQLAEQTKVSNKTVAEFAKAKEEWELATKIASEQALLTQTSLTIQYENLLASNKQTHMELQQSVETGVRLEQSLQETTKQLETFKKHAGVDSLEQLDRLCKLSVEAEYLRQQLNGKENLAAKLQTCEASLATVKDQLFHAEVSRRSLHNQIQEMKGNVRVYVRVRPSEANEDAGIECEPDNRTLNINSDEGKETGFSFDHVWSSKATQVDIFNEVAPLVQSSLDGYNVCLFSYGQTGSGKTFTMQGANMGDSRGIIPRSIEKIMDESARLGERGWVYTLEVTFLEIYNENVRDLLLENSSEQSNLPIMMNPEGGCHVPDLTRIEVTDRNQIDGIMRRAAKHRSVAATNMNSRSSRSHSVFTLHLTGTNELKNVTLKGSLNLCDLAGSERLDKSGATGDRLKETQAINKSLSCLAGVFTSLASKNAHIPYRDSKLTYLLQQCFSAQGKTLMLVNLSPSSTSYGESLCSLRFARQVNNVELGRPAANQTKRQSSAGASISDRISSPLKRNRSATQR